MYGRHLIVSCEHAGNNIPALYKQRFIGAEEDLISHKGWDPGALVIAETIARKFKLKLYWQKYSRLLIECNRSLGHPELFSAYTSGLDRKTKQFLIRKYYTPYRNKVEKEIIRNVSAGKPVLHLSIHTFTPKLNKIERKTDLGILFDPERKGEKRFSIQWKKDIKQLDPTFKVRYNYPYLGVDDGFTTSLRQKFPDDQYWGIEVEINQSLTIWPIRKKMQGLLLKTLGKMYFMEV